MAAVQDVQLRRQRRLGNALIGHLQLYRVVLQVAETALQQHLTMVQDAHMVAHVLQLPQVVAGHQHRRAALRHVAQKQRPHLPPHHRVKAIHRLVQNEVLRHTAHHQPKGRLLLHTLAHPPQHHFLIQREDLLQLLVPLPAEIGVDTGEEFRHLPDARLREVVPVVADNGHTTLHGDVLIYRLTVHQHVAAVLPVDARQMADDGGFPRAVGPYQTVHRAVGHRHGQVVQRPEAVKGLDDVFYLDHLPSPPSQSTSSCSRV